MLLYVGQSKEEVIIDRTTLRMLRVAAERSIITTTKFFQRETGLDLRQAYHTMKKIRGMNAYDESEILILQVEG